MFILELEKIYGEDLPDVLTKGVVTPQDTNVDGASIETYEVPDRIKPKEYKPNLTGDGIKEEEKEVRLFVNPKSGKEKLYKVIYGLNIDLSDLNTDGETREFHIVGDEGSMFNLQVYEDYYYNDLDISTSYQTLFLNSTAGGAAKQVILYSIHTSTVIEAADILSIKLNDSSTVMKIRGSMLPFTIDNIIINKVEILTSDDDSNETIAVLAFM